MPIPIKDFLWLLLIAHTVCAQTPMPSNPHRFFRRDSLPHVFPPDFMPNARLKNFLHQHQSDATNVLRAVLDNMPVRVPDSATHYSVLRSYHKFLQPAEPPIRFRRPLPRR